MENISMKINGMEVSVPKNSTILEACRIAGINIPTLCYMKEINEIRAGIESKWSEYVNDLFRKVPVTIGTVAR